MWPLKRPLQVPTAVLFLGTLMFLVAAEHAAAEGINLSWDDCGSAGSEIKRFACNSGATAPISLIGSFKPPSNVGEFLGTSAEIRVASKSLPNWWAMGEGQCRSTSLTTEFIFPTSGACVNFYDDEAVGGFSYELGGFRANTAKLTIQTAIPIDKRGPVDPTKEYYAFKLLMTPDRTSQCAGCEIPVSLRLNSIQLFQPPESANDPIITSTLGRSVAYWQDQVGRLPELASVVPNAGAPGQTIALNGQNLADVTAVRFNGLEAVFTPVSDQVVNAVVPAGALSGRVEVGTPFGVATSTTDFIVAPRITEFLPRQGPVGTEVLLRGENFTRVTAAKFGNLAATFRVTDDRLMFVTAPQGVVTAPIKVTNLGGDGVTSAPFHVGALVGSVNLSWDDCGSAGGEVKEFACNRISNTPHTLYGSFTPPAGVTQFMGLTAEVGVFSTVLPDWWKHGAAHCRQNSGLEITFGFANKFACSDLWERGFASSQFLYELDYYGPNSARLWINGNVRTPVALDPQHEYYGFKVDLYSGRLTECAGCDVPTRLVLNQVQLLQPEAVGNNPVITAPFQRNNALWQGTPGPLPVISDFTPRLGENGTLVDIEGTNFTGATAVRFGSQPASLIDVISDNLIKTQVPEGARSGRILVKTPFGASQSDSIFIAPPSIQAFFPGQAPVNHQILIEGYNFTRTTEVRFNGLPATFSVNSDQVIAAWVPTGVTDGPITVRNPAGTATSSAIFHLGDLPVDPPIVTVFTPAGGKPGTTVLIEGQNLASPTSVEFGTVPATFVEHSPAQLSATVPENAVSAPIRVTTRGGTSVSDKRFIIAPRITSFSPLSAAIGDPITIRGRSFADVTSVRFAGDLPAAFTISSDSVIVTTVPAGATSGQLRVANIGGTALSDELFQVSADEHAGAINLSWTDCGAFGDEEKSFTCNTNTGGGFTLVGSFIAPSRISKFLGASAELNVESKTDLLPDWWKFGLGTCRGTGLSTDFSFVSGPYSCEDITMGAAAGGFVYEIGRSGPNSARIRLQYAVPLENGGPLTANVEYYAFKVRISRSKVVGDGACDGCTVPVNITLREIQLFQPPELRHDPVLEAVALRNKVRWQPSHNGPNLVGDPSFESSNGPWVPVGGATLTRVPEPHEGSFALKIASPDTAGEYGINDSPNFVPLTPAANRLYRFSAWVKTSTPSVKMMLRTREYLNKVRVQTEDTPWFYPTADWQFVRGQMTTLHGGSALDFQIIASAPLPNTEIHVDDLEVALLGTIPEIRSPREVEARVGVPVEFEVTAKDPSGEAITSLVADLSDLPMLHNATFIVDPDNARAVFRWTPQPEDADWSYTVPFTAVSVLDQSRSTRIDVMAEDNTGSIVTNGSFESPPTAWIGYGLATFERVESARSGSWAVEVSQPPPTPETEGGRPIPTYGINDRPNWIRNAPAAGIPYRFAAWVRGALNTGTAYLRVREYLGPTQIGSTTFSQEIDLSSTWRQLVVDHVTGAPGSTLDLQILCGPLGNLTKFSIDDVAIRPLVDLPAADPAAVHETGGFAFEAPTVFPNPFRGHSKLGFTLQRPGPMRVGLYDLHGRRVRTLYETDHAELGTHHFTIDGKNDRGQRLEPGMFFYRIDSAMGTHHGRFVILE